VPDVTDNCPFAANPDQTDTDHDGLGDACDPSSVDAADLDGLDPFLRCGCDRVANGGPTDLGALGIPKSSAERST